MNIFIVSSDPGAKGFHPSSTGPATGSFNGFHPKNKYLAVLRK